MDLFSDDLRRDPYPMYRHLRAQSPLLRVPPPFNAWLVFDYEGVKRVLSDPETFSSAVPGPRNWFMFADPPRHTKLRGLIMRAFTPRVVMNLETRIRDLSRQLLDGVIGRGEMDLATEYAVPLPMKVIAGMIGIPDEDWPRYRAWSDAILRISYGRSGGAEAEQGMAQFRAATAEMSPYLAEMVAHRRARPADDLLTRLIEAEVDGERLNHDELLGFFQLLVVGGQETTANLINNAMLCLMENREALERLQAHHGLIPQAIEEVLRYRSPVQWVMRTPKQDVELHGQSIPAGALMLVMLGSANRDPKIFQNPEQFEITREPNPHLAFGYGIHFCGGAALSRLEAKIALSDLLSRLGEFELADRGPWEPRKALHVHGPARLPIRYTAAQTG